jgi:hypothetical protein
MQLSDSGGQTDWSPELLHRRPPNVRGRRRVNPFLDYSHQRLERLLGVGFDRQRPHRGRSDLDIGERRLPLGDQAREPTVGRPLETGIAFAGEQSQEDEGVAQGQRRQLAARRRWH